MYDLIITPLVYLTEFFYDVCYQLTKDRGLTILGLSVVVTLLTLPLYMIAEKWQQTERDIQKKLKPGLERIKSAFKGDEAYMISQTFYRQNHYHPIMALRSSFSLLIQIPFFMAAYNYLSSCEHLKDHGWTLGGITLIRDFGAPDGLLSIGSFAINILPLAMTLINCVAGFIYSRGHGKGEKIQIYGCALVFLVLLYDSPAGLVLYWTMNNVLSLVKNVFYKLKNPKKVLYLCAVAAGIVLMLIGFSSKSVRFLFKIGLVLIEAFIVAIPLLIKLFNKFFDSSFNNLDRKSAFPVFLTSSLVLVFLSSLLIPSMLIESEPNLFCYVDGINSPFTYIVRTFLKSTGLFLVWPVCFYFLFSDKTKKVLTFLFSFGAIMCVVNALLFSGNYGPLSQELFFMETQSYIPTLKVFALNVLACGIAAIYVWFALNKKPVAIRNANLILILSMGIFFGKNAVSISTQYKNLEPPAASSSIEPELHFSKTEKNVILMMLDRSISSYMPDIFADKPEIKDRLDGFTFYSKALSFGDVTMIGSPGLFGGYDFTPWEINSRENETLQQKHNKALLSLPVTFHDAGFDVTVDDLPYENYLEQPVTNMYKGFEYVRRLRLRGTYSDLWYSQHNMKKIPYVSNQIKRNFLWLSIFKMACPIFRKLVVFDDWWQRSIPNKEMTEFINNYSYLDYLPELTDASASRPQLFLFDNEAIHEPVILEEPDFTPSYTVTENKNISHPQDSQYSTQLGTYLRVTEFFEHLKDLGVYDNTRIIIVSDHGADATSTLLVKDFNSRGELKIDESFMTNADAPSIAVEGIVENAKNPFTGNPYKVENKYDYMKIYTGPTESTRNRKNTKFNGSKDDWIIIKNPEK